MMKVFNFRKIIFFNSLGKLSSKKSVLASSCCEILDLQFTTCSSAVKAVNYFSLLFREVDIKKKS